MEQTIGKGRVLMFASPPDNVWSDLPVRPAYVPLVNQAARYLAALPADPPYYTVPAFAPVGEKAVVVDPQGKRLYNAEELQQGSAFAKLGETGLLRGPPARSVVLHCGEHRSARVGFDAALGGRPRTPRQCLAGC